MKKVTSKSLVAIERATVLSKENKGITLVALIVTIVILLILAGITIATLFGDNGVINKAQKAKVETEQAEKDETAGLNKMEKDMKKAINGYSWTQNEDGTITNIDGEITLKIGDYIDYNCKSSTATYTSPKEKSGYDNDQIFKANAYNYGWRVLGVDKNTKQLQLISEDFVPLTGGGDRGTRTGQYYYLKGQNGYVNGVDELNKICSIYGTGTGATGARTINVDDIDWITGYNPNNTGKKDQNKTGSGTKCAAGQIYEYGNNVKYTFTGTNVKYESTNGAASGTGNYTQFTYYDEASKTWKSLATNESVTINCSRYSYYPTTLTGTNDINAKVGIASTSSKYKMLFTNSSTGADTANIGNTTNFYYWLGSPYVLTFTGYAYFGLRGVYSGFVNFEYLYTSSGIVSTPYYGVRPVVSLDQKVELKDSGTMKDGCKLYNIVVE